MDWPLGQQMLVGGVDHQAQTTRRRPPDCCEEHVRPSHPLERLRLSDMIMDRPGALCTKASAALCCRQVPCCPCERP